MLISAISRCFRVCSNDMQYIVAGILLLLQLIATTRSLIYTALHDSVATVILNF